MKKKIEHIWYYYKWYILSGLMLILLLFSFMWEKSAQISPDVTLSFVSANQITEAERDRIAKALAPCFEDLNADGQVYVKVNAYIYDAKAMDARDPNAFMASAVQLAAELRLREAVLYFTDRPELLAEQTELQSVGKWGDFQRLSNLSRDYSDFELMAFSENTDILDKLK